MSPTTALTTHSTFFLNMAPVAYADGTHVQAPPMTNDKDLYSRRHSVDNGGLAFALGDLPWGDEGSGKGGWEEGDDGEASYVEIIPICHFSFKSACHSFAELLNRMFTQIQSIVSTPVFSCVLRLCAFSPAHLIIL